MNVKNCIVLVSILIFASCTNQTKKNNLKHKELTAKDILGNPNYLAISYGGYRKSTRDIQPTVKDLKEDMLLLQAIGVKVLRTYNVQLAQASNLLKAIKELKQEDASFEMYVMLGAWIDCKDAWTAAPNHNEESEQNQAEINRAVALAKEYPEIVKIIAVGNEAMVKWATSYYVQPNVILKWVNHLQDLKANGTLSKDLWITSSDDFASWGGGENNYHTEDLTKLMRAVDYISMHTYPMHNTHYNPAFWGTLESENHLSDAEKIETSMLRAKEFAVAQYTSTKNYMKSLGIDKPIHIGETGWATSSNGFYGNNGSKATDEYKQALYYKHMREWTAKENMSCFFFEAFNETWKDAQNAGGSENHFGLFTIDGKAKFALWNFVDNNAFKGLKRGNNTIVKTYNGNKEKLLKEVATAPLKRELASVK